MKAGISTRTGLQRLAVIVTAAAYLGVCTGCKYFKISSREATSEQQVQDFRAKGNYVVLHSGNEEWHLTNIAAVNQGISGNLERNTGSKAYYEKAAVGKANRYEASGEIDEVHIYASTYDKLDGTAVTIPFSAITRVDVYYDATGATIDKNIEKTVLYTVVGGAAAVAVIYALILLTKQSCPFVYAYDGEQYRFAGEIYSGATYPSLERDDYLALPGIGAVDGEYRLKISNKVKEVQHTNLAELLVIDHPEGTGLLVDRNGACHTLGEVRPPVSAASLSGTDVLPQVRCRDSLSYIGEDQLAGEALTAGVVLTFDRPAGARSAKLVLRAKNNFWLDYAFGKFHDLFGDKYGAWVRSQQRAPAKKLRDWMTDQHLPLAVSVEEQGEWRPAGSFDLVGPMALKDDIMVLPLPEGDAGPVRVKLEAGALFWEIDYAGIDFSADQPVTCAATGLKSAVANGGADVAGLLAASDGSYYTQPNIGDEAELRFTAPPPGPGRRTVVLHSRGHYRILRDPTGQPNRAALEKFRAPGQFNRFSRQLMRQALNLAGY